MEHDRLIFRLKDEFIAATPDVWVPIKRQLAKQIAERLLCELDGLPSPQGRLLAEMRDHVKQNILNQGA